MKMYDIWGLGIFVEMWWGPQICFFYTAKQRKDQKKRKTEGEEEARWQKSRRIFLLASDSSHIKYVRRMECTQLPGVRTYSSSVVLVPGTRYMIPRSQAEGEGGAGKGGSYVIYMYVTSAHLSPCMYVRKVFSFIIK